MKIFLKIGLFIVATSIFFTACADKVIEKNGAKSKSRTITEVLNDSFMYDANQRIYKIKSVINNIEDANNLVYKFERFCSEKNGQLIYTSFNINQDYARPNLRSKTNVCEVNNEPYFIIQQLGETSNISYSVSTDEITKKSYLTYKEQITERSSKEYIDKMNKERLEIQKREIAREQKTRMFQNKKDEKTMTFFSSWRYTGSEATCSKKCTDMNVKNTGFKSLKDAQNSNWQLVSKVEEIEEAIDDYCTCSGSSLTLKK